MFDFAILIGTGLTITGFDVSKNTVRVYDSYTGRHITNKVYFKNHKMYIKKYGKWIDLYDFITNKNVPFTYDWDNEVKTVYK